MTHLCRTRPEAGHSGGFTLLELLLAITILASISALVAALWAQTGAWAGENSLSHKTMRLPRVRELMRAQWADRRGAFQLTPSGSSVVAMPDRLSFVTATPILFPDWPLVRAEYIVERDYDTPAGAPPAWRVAYEETRLSDLGQPPQKVDDLIASGRGDEAGRYILLDGLSVAAFERFGTGDRSIQRSGSLVEPDEPSEDPKRPIAPAVNIKPDKDEDEQRWRPFELEYGGLIPAVRLTGIYEEEAFSCVFVIAGSR